MLYLDLLVRIEPPQSEKNLLYLPMLILDLLSILNLK